jgi:stage III sporulation protein AG
VLKRFRKGAARGREVEMKWTKTNLILIPIALVAFIAYISLTFNDTNDEQYVSNTAEGKLEQTLKQIKGVGQVKVYFHYDANVPKESNLLDDYFSSSKSEKTVSGLLIVSEGASDPAIKIQLLETISRVMQLPTHRIMIVPMERKGDVE